MPNASLQRTRRGAGAEGTAGISSCAASMPDAPADRSQGRVPAARQTVPCRCGCACGAPCRRAALPRSLENWSAPSLLVQCRTVPDGPGPAPRRLPMSTSSAAQILTQELELIAPLRQVEDGLYTALPPEQ